MSKQKLNFVIVHGYTATSQSVREPWLKSLLEEDDYAVQAPDLPNPNRPTEGKWVNYALGNIHFDENTVIVSHSLGAVVANDFHFCGKTEPEIWNEIASDFLSEKQVKSA